MTTTASGPAPAARAADRPVLTPPSLAVSAAVVVRRNLLHIKRMPELLLDVTLQPIMFVLLFAFVFGSSIAVDGSSYREFLVPGIMAQTIVFSSFIVALGLTTDLEKGIVDRLRSLPINQSSLLVGRSISSLIHSSIGISVMAVTGLLIGWRVRDGVLHAVAAFGLMLLFGFGMIWVGIWVGSIMKSVEAVNGFMFTVMFPLTFVANTFAPTKGMPSWLRFLAEWNPVSSLTQATRQLWGNGPPAPVSAAWPLHHAPLVTVAWAVLVTAAFAPLALAAFRRRAQDRPCRRSCNILRPERGRLPGWTLTWSRATSPPSRSTPSSTQRTGGCAVAEASTAPCAAAGPGLLEECVERFPAGLATGRAGWTTGHLLPARWVIHVVGPNYRAGERDRALLTSCYREALGVADELGASSLAFPLVSAGVYGWPRADAIAAAVDTLRATPTQVRSTRLVAFGPSTYDEVAAYLGASGATSAHRND